MKMDLLTNATVVDDAIRFVSRPKRILSPLLVVAMKMNLNLMNLIMMKIS
jgi:hypothetical protein